MIIFIKKGIKVIGYFRWHSGYVTLLRGNGMTMNAAYDDRYFGLLILQYITSGANEIIPLKLDAKILQGFQDMVILLIRPFNSSYFLPTQANM